MNVLKPGYIPDGWTRGDRVRILQPPEPGARGAVIHAPDGDIKLDGPPGDAAMVMFRYEDTPEMLQWLEWWKE